MFLGGAIGFAGVPLNRAAEAGGLGHGFGELTNAQVNARAHVEERGILRPWLTLLKREDTGLTEVVGMKELA